MRKKTSNKIKKNKRKKIKLKEKYNQVQFTVHYSDSSGVDKFEVKKSTSLTL